MHEVLQPSKEPAAVPDFIGTLVPPSLRPKEAPKELPKVIRIFFESEPRQTVFQGDNKSQNTDLSKIREKHAKEHMSERWAMFLFHTVPFPSS